MTRYLQEKIDKYVGLREYGWASAKCISFRVLGKQLPSRAYISFYLRLNLPLSTDPLVDIQIGSIRIASEFKV